MRVTFAADKLLVVLSAEEAEVGAEINTGAELCAKVSDPKTKVIVEGSTEE